MLLLGLNWLEGEPALPWLIAVGVCIIVVMPKHFTGVLPLLHWSHIYVPLKQC
jgi:hypothetical protein